MTAILNIEQNEKPKTCKSSKNGERKLRISLINLEDAYLKPE